MLKKIRQIFAVIFLTFITLLFLDFSGTIHAWFGWMAKVQFLPALLALNVGVITGLVALTLLFGRVYCSVICPLGVMQDVFACFGKMARKNRYSYSPAKTTIRVTFLVLMALAIAAGIGSLVALLAPYSSYGRIVQSLLSPLWLWGNNLLASWAERADSYAFYSVDIWLKSSGTLAVAAVTLVLIGVLAWRNGRTYCNTVCPVGTVLGFLSKYSLFRPVIDTSKCNGCGLCARNCKSACIDSRNHQIDYSRCVSCMDCLDKCHRGAISYGYRRSGTDSREAESGGADRSRRQFMVSAAAVTAAAAVKAQEKTVDGGLAVIADKKIPQRSTPIVPPGAIGLRNMSSHCTACQLCVTVCPNGVLRPSSGLLTFMQPESSYERGYCRPECVKCSEVCPAGAIRPISTAEKSSIQIGHAVWIKDNCVPLTDGVECGNCARHCPVGAIVMVPSVNGKDDSPKIPAVNAERCIGCGACENLCPSRPFSAIYVEGHENHRVI
ncbi:MAG: 4Fe-4S binding protein [Duncaniella sp.]|uniref:4Fe-4S binding protein n=1 Tax=Duncaniella sp. TaxID=2518496 RepID=UPI0023BC7DAC|nr:4Fe-4S binding protein [Duncaniella sp.]MDE5989248.1 4Fe-4S binding protein [Duncaniella sp.]